MKQDKAKWSVDKESVSCIVRRTQDTDASVYQATLVSDAAKIDVKIIVGPDSRDLIQDRNKDISAVVRKYLEGWLKTAWNPSTDQEIDVDYGYLSRILETV